MEKSRKKHSIRNLAFGLVYQFIHLILIFVCKTCLIYVLGEKILGVNSLFSNILSLLSLAELGLGNVMLITLYKPMSEQNNDKVAAYMNFYKKLYNIIAIVIFVAGLCVTPFINKLISADIDISNKDIIIYFLIFLMNTSVSYFMVYKQMIINADQNVFIIKIFNLVSLVIQSTLKIVFLLIIPNFKIFIIIELVCNFLTNLSLSIYVDKKYPQYKNKNCKLEPEEKKKIGLNVKDTMLYKIGSVIINNTDSIIISVLISTVVVGYVSNYNLILTALIGFLSMFNSAVFASIGSVSLEGDNKKALKFFRTMLLIFCYLAAFCAITIFVSVNDFMVIWLKDSSYIIDNWSVLLMCIYFYMQNIFIPVTCYRENYGLFKKVKYYLLFAAVINIACSILFTKLIGLPGVFLGTIVCRLFTIDILEPPYLYKEVFKTSSRDYYLRILVYTLIGVVGAAICYGLCSLIPFVSIWSFLIKCIISFVVITALYVACLFKTTEFQYLLSVAKEMLFDRRKRKKAECLSASTNNGVTDCILNTADNLIDNNQLVELSPCSGSTLLVENDEVKKDCVTEQENVLKNSNNKKETTELDARAGENIDLVNSKADYVNKDCLDIKQDDSKANVEHESAIIEASVSNQDQLKNKNASKKTSTKN